MKVIDNAIIFATSSSLSFFFVQWGFGTTYPISFTQFNVVAFDAGAMDGQHVVYSGTPSWATLSGIEQFPTVIGFIVIGR